MQSVVEKLSNYTTIRELIKRFSGSENTFTVPKIYVEYTGDLTTAVLLNQIVFYSDKSKRTDGYFYKTYKEWYEDCCLTERQVRHSVKKLKEKGVLETKLMKANGSPTVHYKLNYDKLVESILTFCQIPFEHNVRIQPNIMSDSLTEITTEKTTEITTDIYIPYSEIVSYLNEKAQTSYRHTTKKTQSLIQARWNEGFRLDEFKKVIDNKVSEWIHDSKMNKFLRPETLFGTKFESYLNQKGVKQNAKPKPSIEGYNFDRERELNF